MARSSKAETTKNTETAQGLPLFFQTPAALDSARHVNAGIANAPNLTFARACNSVPLNVVEFIEAGHFYPIVFTDEAMPMPVAVLGFEQTNPFITESNLWRDGCYIPAYVRQYPFILYQAPNSDKLYLCVDEAADAYVADATDNAEASGFYAGGEPSDVTRRALEFANAYYQHMAITRNFCDALVQHSLLAPYQASAEVNGTQKQLQGFRMIDESAFNALPEAVFAEFRTKGWLPFIYLALASAANWKRLSSAS